MPHRRDAPDDEDDPEDVDDHGWDERHYVGVHHDDRGCESHEDTEPDGCEPSLR